jgi:transposase
MKKQHTVCLTDPQRSTLRAWISSGHASARTLARARILLKADTQHEGGACSDPEICQALEVSRPTVERVRKRVATQGGEAALFPKPRLTAPERCLDGEQEAQLIALACSTPPQGQKRWTLRLLASGLIQREIVDTISHETVRQTLKKPAQAWVEEGLVPSARSQCRVRLLHGRCPGGLPATLGPQTAPRL